MTAGGPRLRRGLSGRGLMFVLSIAVRRGKDHAVRRSPDRNGCPGSEDVGVREPRGRCGPAKSMAATYHFIDNAKFDLIAENETSLARIQPVVFREPLTARRRAPVEAALLGRGRTCCSTSDWQGTAAIAGKRARGRCPSAVFIPAAVPPPTWKNACTPAPKDSDESHPGTDEPRQAHEMSHWAEYDYIVINHDIDEGVCRGAVLS